MTGPVVGLRQLNRTTLQRQLLLEPSPLAPLAAVQHLVGLQAQVPQNPYVALWSRLAGFDPAAVERLLEDRQLVRTIVMRSTVHLIGAAEARAVRAVVQPVMAAELARHPEHGPALVGVDLEPVLRDAVALFAERGPLTNTELREEFAAARPDLDPAALAYACRCLLPLVQVPPRGLWHRSGTVRVVPADQWCGEESLAEEVDLDGLVLRYLAAFGPATNADLATWSRLTGFRAVTDRLRDRLRTYTDERGRELFDLADLALADPDTVAPARFLPEYDNALLSHADRGRFVTEEAVAGFGRIAGPVRGTALSDGVVVAGWRLAKEADRCTTGQVLEVDLVVRPSRAARTELVEEAVRLADFLPGDVTDVRVSDPA